MMAASGANQPAAGNVCQDITQKSLQSAVLSVAVHVIAGSAYNVAIVGGALAVTATVIEALVRPLLLGIFPENPWIPAMLTFGAILIAMNDLGQSASSKMGVRYEGPTLIGLVLQILLFVTGWDNSSRAMVFIR
jgi:hypothetical protein